jgi:hypothetical protein
MIFKHFEDFTQAQFEPLKSFRLQDELNPKVWDKDELDPKIKEELLKLADDYFNNLELGNLELEDVIFTGSLANFNWSFCWNFVAENRQCLSLNYFSLYQSIILRQCFW